MGQKEEDIDLRHHPVVGDGSTPDFRDRSGGEPVWILTSGAATGEKEQKLLAGLVIASHESARAKAKSRFPSSAPRTL